MYLMKKGFETDIILDKTPDFKNMVEKPLNPNENHNKKVDINVLKARAQEAQAKESKKNISIFVFNRDY